MRSRSGTAWAPNGARSGWDRWAWEQLDASLALRSTLAAGALLCVLRGPTHSRLWSTAGVRAQLHHAATQRRAAPVCVGPAWAQARC
jgi:hypothetical protein